MIRSGYLTLVPALGILLLLLDCCVQLYDSFYFIFYFIMFGYLLEPCSFLMRETEETQKGGEMGRGWQE